MKHLIYLLPALLILYPWSVDAKSKIRSKGQLALEGRIFENDNNSQTIDEGLGLFGRLEFSHKHRPFAEKIRLYGRLDQRDPDRTLLVVEEMWAEAKFGPFKLRVGADLLNWSATEAFHPADIINARNLDSDVENYEKLGEPMVQLITRLGSGRLSLYFMPFFTRTVFPTNNSRLNPLPGINLGRSLQIRANGNVAGDDFGLQGAVRLTQNIFGIDLGLHAVHHLDRNQPEFVIDRKDNRLHPVFRTVTQFGGTIQSVFSGVIFKVETGYRMFSDPSQQTLDRFIIPPQASAITFVERDHFQIATGLEYSLLVSSSAELTLLLEGQSIFGVSEEIRRSLQIFQRDALAGFRLTLGDEASTEIRGNAIVDLEQPDNAFFSTTVSRRFFNDWLVTVSGRIVVGPSNQTVNLVPLNSDYARISIARYF